MTDPIPPDQTARPDPTVADHDLVARARAWMADDPDPATRRELASLVEDGPTEALAAHVARPLRFGTSGLRGPLGCGPARVNRVTARRLASGLVDLLARRARPGAAPGPVVVGGDARHGSAEMVDDVVGVLAASGLDVLRATAPEPTPLLAYAVRDLGAAAGVVVTASHNPAGDNGLKVYLGDGIQVLPPDDATLADALVEPLPGDRHPRAGAVGRALDDGVVERYRAMAAALVEPGPRDVRIVHTALHGVAASLAVGVLRDAGFEVVEVVSQSSPDPAFPTVATPNPEDPRALREALALARDVDADLVLAHDPDGDRLSVSVPSDDGWWSLSGNELGALLCDHLCAAHQRARGASEREPGVVASTLVSTALIGRIATGYGVEHVVSPTGFKWVMQASLDPRRRFVFGFEEALGYAVTDAVRDKDGITAGLVVADLVARLGRGGLARRSAEIDQRHGVHLSQTLTTRFAPVAGRDPRARVMAALRADPPARLGGEEVVAVVDHRHDPNPVDLVELVLASGATAKIRPSGTEPILKAYLEVVAEPPGAGAPEAGRTEAGRRLAALAEGIGALTDAHR